ncbi:MAG: Yip1 family protein [Hyphomonadaceae bacterium]
MSSEDGQHESGGTRRFNINAEEARARAQQALRKSEFILSRAYGLLREPSKEWQQIRAEETTIPNLLLGYVAPLAALPPLATLIGSYVMGAATSISSAIIGAVVAWVVGVAMVYLLGLIIAAVADNFDSDRDELAAQKIAAYSITPFFLSTLLLIWPPLLWVPILALGAMVYLIYRGLPILMKTPADRAMAYAATVTIAALVTFIVQMAVASCVGR